MKSDESNLSGTGAIILNGTGAIRAHGDILYAWIARMQYVNECGIVFHNGKDARINVVKGSPVYIEDELAGGLMNGSMASDGHYVVISHMPDLPAWISRNDSGYAIPEYDAKTLRCARCGVIHHKKSTPCDCVMSSPALTLDDVSVIGLRIYPRRCDDYIKNERTRLLNRMFSPVMPTASQFAPEIKNAGTTTKIPEESQHQKLSEPS